MPRIGNHLRSLFWKPRVQDEVDAEFEFHVAMRTRELVAQGLSPDAALAEALRRFGDIANVNATCRQTGELRDRDMQRAEYLEELGHDVRYALRQLGRARGFTVVAALTLALGIGATTAIFSVVHAVVLRPLPFSAPERLVRIYATSPATTASDEVSPKDFVAWRRQNRAFERMAPVETRSLTLVDGAELPQQVTAIRTTADYFPMLGVQPLHGRTFTPDEDRPGHDRVAVLSHRFWTGRFGADRGVVGHTVRLNAIPFTVIGVMPASFDVSTSEVDLWTPIAFTAEEETTVDMGYLDLIGRLRTGVTIARAQTDMSALARRLAERPQDQTRSVRVVSYMDDFVGSYRERLFVLLGAVALVLLIACVNVANLLLARGVSRHKEIAIRAALGAGRARVVRQLLAESLVLGLIGGAAGLALAYWAVAALKSASPEGVPRLTQASLDGTALAFALVVSIVSSVLFGLVPAFRSAGSELQPALKDGGRSSVGGSRDRLRQTLVVLEVALSLVLLVGAGLLIRSAVLTQRVDPGLDPSRLWSGWITLPTAEYSTSERVTQTYERILDGVRGVPGVDAAAAISVAPFSGLRALGLFVPEGRPVDRDNALMANLRLVSPGLFGALGVPFRQGRDFTERDGSSAPHVVVVNEAFARLAWPGEGAIGKRLYGAGGGTGKGPLPREVVGVVGATHEDGLREERRPAVYYPLRQVSPMLWQSVQNSMVVVARTRVEPLSVTKSVQDAVRAVDRNVPVDGVLSMEQRMAESLATARFNTHLLTVLGAVGLLLAVVGIYGVVGYFVSQRTPEIGLRMALGATPRQVLALIVGQGMRPVLIGIALGGVAAAAIARVLESQLYGVGAADPVTFACVATVVALAAVLAAVLPARRAARVDPKAALGM